MKNLGVFGLYIFFLKTFLEKIKYSVSNSISLILTIINLKMIIKIFLS